MTAVNRAETSSANVRRVRVWDLPTRLFHWTLLVCVLGSVVTAKVGGNATVWHFRLGLATLALIAFRLVWGLVGGRWSRFTSFIYGPGAVLRYLRGQPRPGEHFEVGHNPLGSLSVFGLLGILAVQVATGLVADDEIASTGPLITFVSGAVSSAATAWHRTGGQWLILALVGLHVAAIVFYRLHKRVDLVGPMLHGDKLLAVEAPDTGDTALRRVLALLIGAACAALAIWVNSFGA
ncbi:cytochrome b/b6 domain-containing protein [Leptothrix discophora]|uniref:Cytochrome b/b6 domain-containing protein n=1 Tax=Leptothrix discophora TaxID=89 RepID=A0ABT9G494_LEPDI|nr:cytochrome b/b6 domain-containing protein [Leptothrix discophora]MDP4301310.1 cytochrome b/b6 domain-containing protein [Leptothrix discophora]